MSYIRTRRQYPVRDTFYHQTLYRLIDRGMAMDAFCSKLPREDLYWMFHDWIIGLQIGWCISPDEVQEARYLGFIQSFVEGQLRQGL